MPAPSPFSQDGSPDTGHAAHTRHERIQQTIQQRYLTRFFVELGSYTAIILFVVALVLFIKYSNIWYRDDPFYLLLRAGDTLFPWVMATLWLGGAVVLLLRAWRRNAADIMGLVASIEQMQNDEDTIAVPENLIEVQSMLAEIRSENRRSKQAATEARQRKSELIVYLAHDLKTPLTSVIGYLNLLSEAPNMPPQQRENYTRIALDKAERLETLIAQFFEISRFNLNEMVLEVEHFDLRYLLAQMVDEFYPVLSEQRKTISIHAPDELWLVGDAGKLARVFNNLLRNAVSYSNADSAIVIAARQDAEQVTVSVTNRGKTIPAHRLDNIFEQFYRLDEARASESGGSGLGLAIAREIVMQHGGGITALSKNGTTTFTVALPSSQADALAHTAALPSSQADAPAS
jgi:two-component system sensor histidine kinase VanS